MPRLNYTGSGLRISGQLPKRGVNLRYRPVSQWLSCTAWANRICQIQCGTALCIPQAQDARTLWGYNSQWKHRTLAPHGGAHCGPRGRSTKQPSPANHQSGDNNPAHRQFLQLLVISALIHAPPLPRNATNLRWAGHGGAPPGGPGGWPPGTSRDADQPRPAARNRARMSDCGRAPTWPITSEAAMMPMRPATSSGCPEARP